MVVSFPKYTKEHMLYFADSFKEWGKGNGEDMEYLLKVPYAANTKHTRTSKALSYYIYQNYYIGNKRFYKKDLLRKEFLRKSEGRGSGLKLFYREYLHRKPEPQRTIMRILSAEFDDLPLFVGDRRTHKGIPITKVISWRIRIGI